MADVYIWCSEVEAKRIAMQLKCDHVLHLTQVIQQKKKNKKKQDKYIKTSSSKLKSN